MLLDRVRRGDRSAFSELYQQYHPRLYGYLLRLLANPVMVEEVLDDVMLVVWTDARKFRGAAAVSTWIFGIAVNKIRKKIKGKFPPYEDLEFVDGETSERSAPDKTTYQSELREQMRMAINKLSPEHREVLDLTYYQGLSIKEIAEIMDCPLNTVKTRMFYARKRLGGILQEMGIGGEV